MINVILIAAAVALLLAGCITVRSVGRKPRGARLEKVRQSAHWNGKRFENVHNTPTMTSDKGFWRGMKDFMSGGDTNRKPAVDVPTIKTDLFSLPADEDVVVWLGHSSLLIQTGGKRFLFDPILTCKFPVRMFMRPFMGSAVYSPDDIPPVDYLIITHNHWDHLDYPTIRALKDKVGEAPHLAEELWQKAGHEPSVANAKWPEYNEALTIDAEIQIVCQINGKVRAKIMLSKDATKDQIIAAAKENENVKKYLDGSTIVKEIVVPGKLVSFVVK